MEGRSHFSWRYSVPRILTLGSPSVDTWAMWPFRSVLKNQPCLLLLSSHTSQHHEFLSSFGRSLRSQTSPHDVSSLTSFTGCPSLANTLVVQPRFCVSVWQQSTGFLCTGCICPHFDGHGFMTASSWPKCGVLVFSFSPAPFILPVHPLSPLCWLLGLCSRLLSWLREQPWQKTSCCFVRSLLSQFNFFHWLITSPRHLCQHSREGQRLRASLSCLHTLC